ncbi:Desmoglein-3 [Labeo rohita]|uniref:Desmoglein-3 n=1 Tax=Labeo rohita TaxID=84645 RepID=A0ABQ8LGU1_LABRO|nr:Desmoglein-3 [Labeo rohita]
MIRTVFYIRRRKQSSFQHHTPAQDPSAALATPLRTGNVFITVTWASSGSTPHSAQFRMACPVTAALSD